MDRRPNDYYPTPEPHAKAIVAFLKRAIYRDRDPGCIIEPSAGNGVFVRPLRRSFPGSDITAVDLCEENYGALREAGADHVAIMDWELWAKWWSHDPNVDRRNALIVGNPPYSLAEEHVTAAISAMGQGSVLAFLLRLSFLCTKKRSQRLFAGVGNFAGLAPFAERPSFVNGRTDSSEYGLFIWIRDFRGPAVVYPHIWTDGD